MNYKKINDDEIEIIPGKTPVDKILETMARISYESAKPPGSDFLELLDTKSKEIDFSEFAHLNCYKVLDIDYVNQRQCKTKVRKTNDGKFVFDAWLYKMNRGSPKLFLDKVKSKLEENVEDSKTSAQSDEPKSVFRKRLGISDWLDLLLDAINPWI
jgi:hypothetical protein